MQTVLYCGDVYYVTSSFVNKLHVAVTCRYVISYFTLWFEHIIYCLSACLALYCNSRRSKDPSIPHRDPRLAAPGTFESASRPTWHRVWQTDQLSYQVTVSRATHNRSNGSKQKPFIQASCVICVGTIRTYQGKALRIWQLSKWPEQLFCVVQDPM